MPTSMHCTGMHCTGKSDPSVWSYCLDYRAQRTVWCALRLRSHASGSYVESRNSHAYIGTDNSLLVVTRVIDVDKRRRRTNGSLHAVVVYLSPPFFTLMMCAVRPRAYCCRTPPLLPPAHVLPHPLPAAPTPPAVEHIRQHVHSIRTALDPGLLSGRRQLPPRPRTCRTASDRRAPAL
jgi:hypothetical protein